MGEIQTGIDELCTDVKFSDQLLPCKECDKDEAIEFLLVNYDPQGRKIFSWLLNQSNRRFCLRARNSNAIVAFACGIPLYVRLPDFEGYISFATLFCITKALRNTGLVKQFLQWSKLYYQMSTSTTLFAFEPVCTITRFLQRPNRLDKKTYQSFMRETLGGPVTISKNKQDTLPYVSKEFGVDWTKTALDEPVQTLALMVHGEPVFAALVIDLNENIKQVIGYNGSSKHMGLCWAWLATYLKSIIVFDAWLMPDDVSKAEQTDKNNKYYVYVYNMQVDARQNLAIPLL
jgi:hypothetical protein